MADLTGLGTVVLAVAAGGGVAGGAGRWLYRRGGDEGKLAESIDRLTGATEANTSAVADMSTRFAAFEARTDTRLDEHQRMIVQHDKRLARQPGT